jgi:hypothetical protein
MTITIELTPEQEQRLRAIALSTGTDEVGAVRKWIESLPQIEPERKPHGLGILAGVGGTVGDFLREKHEETAREGEAYQQKYPAAKCDEAA